jgi:DNA-3-methyladenine glycosylase II
LRQSDNACLHECGDPSLAMRCQVTGPARTNGDSARKSGRFNPRILAHAVAGHGCTATELARICLCYGGSPAMTETVAPAMTLPFDLAEAVRHLSACDEQLKNLIAETRAFQIDLKNTHSPYEVLLRAITYQSISGKAASTIWGRIKELGKDGHPPEPAKMLKIPVARLRKAGLSAAKAASMKDLAKKTLAGIVPTHEQALKLSDEELVERLDSVRGIGAWTVEMFLIFRLGRPDVLPIHDLGVKKGWSVAYGKKHMPTPKELLKFGERWRPYRSVASWYMWRAFEKAGYAATKKIRVRKARRKKRV